MIAVSSIFTYDIYQTYFNPGASGRRLIYTSHCAVIAYATIMAAFCTGLYYAGISMGYVTSLHITACHNNHLTNPPATSTSSWA